MEGRVIGERDGYVIVQSPSGRIFATSRQNPTSSLELDPQTGQPIAQYSLGADGRIESQSPAGQAGQAAGQIGGIAAGGALSNAIGSALSGGGASVPFATSGSITTGGSLSGVGSGAAGAAGAGGAGGAGGVGALPIAAGALATIAGMRGLGEARDSFDQRDNQRAIMQAGTPGNAVITGANKLIGEPVGQKDAARLTALSNPITMPLGIADVLGIDIFGKADPEKERRKAMRGTEFFQQFYPNDNATIEFSDVVFREPQSGYNPKTGESTGGQSFNIDLDDPMKGQLAGALDPLMTAMTGGKSPKLASDITGIFTNAASTSSNPNEAVKDLYDRAGQSGVGHSQIYGSILESHKAGRLTDEQAAAQLAAVDKQFGVKNPNQGKGGKEEFTFKYV